MTRFSYAISLGFAILGLAACGAAHKLPPAPAEAANSVAPHDNLSRIVDRYWEERAIPGRPLSPQLMADSLALERRYLAELLAVPRAALDDGAKLTYDMFRRQRELSIEIFTYPSELLPVNPFDGPPQQLVRAAAEARQHPLRSLEDYQDWLARIDAYREWNEQAIANMREGMRRGYTSPRVLMERLLPWLQALGEDTPANVFYAAWRTLPPSIADPERARISAQLNAAVKDKLLPAFRQLHDFIQREYLPRARLSLALSALPLGASWYASLVKRATGMQSPPNEIHGVGTAEVERLHARLLALSAASPAAPAAGGDLLSAYQDLKAQTLAAMPTLFADTPPADFEIRAAAPVGDATPPLEYQPAAPGGAGAILYVDTASASRRAEVAAFLGEAIPGRHYQSAIQRQRSDLPKFRRFGAEPAFVEGWALYAASLGDELGLYRDDAAKRDAVLGDLSCAVALVVDTGLQTNNWTRAQAVDYLRAQLTVDEAAAGLMTDRFVAFPGDSLACKIGERKIQALRARAQQLLGARFDSRDFHSELLKDGAMPLDLLQAKMQLWMEARR
jgi:uncharacterized protein (DUF885 family)